MKFPKLRQRLVRPWMPEFLRDLLDPAGEATNFDMGCSIRFMRLVDPAMCKGKSAGQLYREAMEGMEIARKHSDSVKYE